MTKNNENTINNIVVVGNSIEAWLTACTLSARLASANKQITLLKTAEVDKPKDVLSVSSAMQIYVFFKYTGVSFKEFYETSRFSFDLGDQFYFNDTLRPFFHANSGSNINIDGVDICEVISFLNLQGATTHYDDFSLVAQLAKQNRFFNVDLKQPSENVLSVIGGNFIERDCKSLFEKYQERFPFKVVNAKQITVKPGLDFTIESITTESQLFHAELFIDCSGDQRLLSGPDRTVITDRVLGVTSRFTKTDHHKLKPNSIVSVAENSLKITKPLNDRIYQLEIFPEYQQEDHKLALNYLREAWLGNVISIGDTYAEIGYGPAKTLDCLCNSLSRLVDFFPRSTHFGVLRNHYNRAESAQKDGNLNINSLFHQLSKLQYDTSGTSLNDVDYLSDELKETIAIYQASANLPKLAKNEVWSREFFFSMLMGVGIHPTEVSAFCTKKSPSYYEAILSKEKRRLADKAKSHPYFHELLAPTLAS